MTAQLPGWLRDPAIDPMDQVAFLGLAVKQVRPKQRHVGILYRGEADDVRMLHLAWHYDLQDGPASDSYFWIDPNLPRLIKRGAAGLCRKIAKHYKEGEQIPYGLDQSQGTFDRNTGTVLLSHGATGLTCATFVLAVLRTYNILLLDTDSWPHRAEDDAWLKSICRMLRAHNAAPQHIQTILQGVGSFQRFRPEEVAVGSVSTPLPASFAFASARGTELVSCLSAMGAREASSTRAQGIREWVRGGVRAAMRRVEMRLRTWWGRSQR